MFCLKYVLSYVNKMQASRRLIVLKSTVWSTGNNRTLFKNFFDTLLKGFYYIILISYLMSTEVCCLGHCALR
jgi:hypothetical protein